MATIKFITASGGLSTPETLLQIISKHPEGSTIKQLSNSLNRPVSMINLCLNNLLTEKKVKIKLSENRMQRLVFPQQFDKRKILIQLLSKI